MLLLPGRLGRLMWCRRAGARVATAQLPRRNDAGAHEADCLQTPEAGSKACDRCFRSDRASRDFPAPVRLATGLSRDRLSASPIASVHSCSSDQRALVIKYKDSNRQEVVAQWEVEKLEACFEGRSASMRRVYSKLRLGRRFVESTIRLHEAGLDSRPKEGGTGGRPRTFDELDMEHLQDIVRSGRCSTALEFCQCMELEAGCVISERRMQEILSKELRCRIVKAQVQTADKWTQESYIRLLEFLDDIKDISRIRFRFYDQTNFSRRELTYTKRRKLPDMDSAPPVKTPTNMGSAYSVFGLTSIQPDQDPLYINMFQSGVENSQTAQTHYGFFWNAIQDGAVREGDVIITDNWSAHHSVLGNSLKGLLAENSVYMLFLPPKHSHLNAIEHVWRTLKARARKVLRSYDVVDVPSAPWLLQEVVNGITHYDVLKYMEHDGYHVEERTLSMLERMYF
eukprot:scaffold942_cov260-Pinguiococcus_pyrenoidosus.AAC.17